MRDAGSGGPGASSPWGESPQAFDYQRKLVNLQTRPGFLSEQMGARQLAVTLGALLLCVFLAALDSSIVANALPRVVADLNGFELYAWVTTGYLLSSTAVVPIGGKLGDRYGRKPMLIGGASFFLATTLLCGLAQNMPQLIAVRTLQGIGGGLLLATVFAIMGQLLTPAQRARISGLITLTFSLAGAVGPVVGGFLTDAFTWRAVFYVNLPFGALALLVLWRSFPAVRYEDRRLPIDFGGAITSVVSIVLLLVALSLGGREYAWDSPLVLGLLASGIAVLAVFLWLEGRAEDPVLPLWLFRNNVVAISATNSLAQSMAVIAVSLFVPLYAQEVLGASATLSGTIMVPLLVGMVVSNLAVGILIAHIGRYKGFALAGFALDTAGFVMLSVLGAGVPYVVLGACLALLGLGTGMIFPTLTLSYQSAVEFSELGVATSLNQFCRSIGSTLGSAVFGSMLVLLEIQTGLEGALHWVFAAGALVMATGLIGSMFWREVPMRRGTPSQD